MNSQPQQQAVFVNPDTVSGQLPAPTATNSHANGSFGTAFIVLAVIIVVSGIACCLGRLGNKHKAGGGKGSKKPTSEVASSKQSQQNPNFRLLAREKMRGRERDEIGGVDLEFGFDKGLRPPGKGDARVHSKANMLENGHVKGGSRGGGGESFVIHGGHLKPGP